MSVVEFAGVIIVVVVVVVFVTNGANDVREVSWRHDINMGPQM